MALENFTQPQYHSRPTDLSGGLQGLYSMVHSFLGLVQPNTFPADLLTRLIQYKAKITNPEVYKEVLLYEAGFLACIVIGLLFIILVPLVGLCFCCCRCCGRCGGLMYQKQGKNTDCKRRTFFVTLLAVTTILLAGNICAYISNHHISQSVSGSFSTLNNTMDNLHLFLHSIPQEIDVIIDSSSMPLNQANQSLQDIGQTLGNKIKNQLGGRINAALDRAEHLFNAISFVEKELQTVNDSRSYLQQLQKELDQNLTIVRDDINKTLQECGRPCQNVSVERLEPGANLTAIPDVSRPLQLLAKLTNSNPNDTIAKARKILADIPKNVSEQTKTVVSEAQAHLQRVKNETEDSRGNFSILGTLENISTFMNDIINVASNYEADIVTYDGYRWIVGFCLCCLVLVIIVFNVLGLLFGALGLDPQVMPTKRSCLSDTGGNFFMASIGFSFLFSWLLMLLVLLMFLVGGSTYTLVCRPWASGHLLQFLDTPGLFPEFNLTRLLQLNSSSVNLSSMYKNCENNAPLWSTLHLDEIIHLDEILNISKYTQNVNSTLKKINVSLGSTDLLSDEQKRLLQELGTEDGLLNLNFDSALEQINQNLTKQDLSALATELEQLAEKLSIDDPSKEKLKQHANELKKIQDWINITFDPEMQVLKSSIRNLQASVPKIPELVNSTLTQINNTQIFLTQRIEEIVKNETLAFVNTLLGFFELYMDWAKSTIKGEVGRCGPAAWAVDSVNTVICSWIVDSLVMLKGSDWPNVKKALGNCWGKFMEKAQVGSR
ncbi:prominin-1-A-like isoform X2 [Rhineura floridana]|uniref:prominin-1-A-like isoform X2 n=1 Tax=Rhineura floridana TaxID=261503 RepID=UPI002AC7E6DE|nr:prominin-1-A-like isoform X2 [Rhineura floridana]